MVLVVVLMSLLGACHSLHLRLGRGPAHALRSSGVQLCEAPTDGLVGVDIQRRLGEITFSELTSTLPDRETILSGGAPQASLSPGAVVVGLCYGQLTRGSAAGTRVLIKAYSSQENNELAAARAAAAAQVGSTEARMRERLAAMAGGR